MFCTIVQSVLLHSHLCVAQKVLFLGKFSLSIENLQVEVAIAQSQYHITLFYTGALLHHFLSYYAAFLRRDLHHLDRHHLSVKPYIIVKLATCHVANRNIVAVDSHSARCTSKYYPYKQCHNSYSRSYVPDVAARE